MALKKERKNVDFREQKEKNKARAQAEFYKNLAYHQTEEIWKETNVMNKAIYDREQGLIDENECYKRFLNPVARMKEEPDEAWWSWNHKAIRIDANRKEKEIAKMMREGYADVYGY